MGSSKEHAAAEHWQQSRSTEMETSFSEQSPSNETQRLQVYVYTTCFSGQSIHKASSAWVTSTIARPLGLR